MPAFHCCDKMPEIIGWKGETVYFNSWLKPGFRPWLLGLLLLARVVQVTVAGAEEACSREGAVAQCPLGGLAGRPCSLPLGPAPRLGSGLHHAALRGMADAHP